MSFSWPAQVMINNTATQGTATPVSDQSSFSFAGSDSVNFTSSPAGTQDSVASQSQQAVSQAPPPATVVEVHTHQPYEYHAVTISRRGCLVLGPEEAAEAIEGFPRGYRRGYREYEQAHAHCDAHIEAAFPGDLVELYKRFVLLREQFIEKRRRNNKPPPDFTELTQIESRLREQFNPGLAQQQQHAAEEAANAALAAAQAAAAQQTIALGGGLNIRVELLDVDLYGFAPSAMVAQVGHHRVTVESEAIGPSPLATIGAQGPVVGAPLTPRPAHGDTLYSSTLGRRVNQRNGHVIPHAIVRLDDRSLVQPLSESAKTRQVIAPHPDDEQARLDWEYYYTILVGRRVGIFYGTSESVDELIIPGISVYKASLVLSEASAFWHDALERGFRLVELQ